MIVRALALHQIQTGGQFLVLNFKRVSVALIKLVLFGE